VGSEARGIWHRGAALVLHCEHPSHPHKKALQPGERASEGGTLNGACRFSMMGWIREPCVVNEKDTATRIRIKQDNPNRDEQIILRRRQPDKGPGVWLNAPPQRELGPGDKKHPPRSRSATMCVPSDVRYAISRRRHGLSM